MTGHPVELRRTGWPSLAIAIVFGLFYAYDLFEAVSNAVGVPAQINGYNAARASVQLDPVPIPWGWLIVDVLASPVAYVLAFLLARRRSVVIAALVFFIGLTVVSAVTLTAVALA